MKVSSCFFLSDCGLATQHDSLGGEVVDHYHIDSGGVELQGLLLLFAMAADQQAAHDVVDADGLVSHSAECDGIAGQGYCLVCGVLTVVDALEGDEVGGVGGVGSDEDGARVFDSRIVPMAELVAGGVHVLS